MTINLRKYELHVLNHNYATADKSPNSLVIVEQSKCDDNVIEVPFAEDENDANDLDSLIGRSVITVQNNNNNNNNYNDSGGGVIKVRNNLIIFDGDGDLDKKTSKVS